MSGYQVVFCDRSVEIVEGADAYRQEGQLTTFFRTAPGRTVVDSWSTRLASFRTSTVTAVRRLDNCDASDRTQRPRRAPGTDMWPRTGNTTTGRAADSSGHAIGSSYR